MSLTSRRANRWCFRLGFEPYGLAYWPVDHAGLCRLSVEIPSIANRGFLCRKRMIPATTSNRFETILRALAPLFRFCLVPERRVQWQPRRPQRARGNLLRDQHRRPDPRQRRPREWLGSTRLGVGGGDPRQLVGRLHGSGQHCHHQSGQRRSREDLGLDRILRYGPRGSSHDGRALRRDL